MAKTYGEDLRGRVIAAVEGGLSRRAAAERFQVGISTAINWVRAWREHGRAVAKTKGGDTRSHRIEAHRDAILQAIEAQKDITLAELAAMLEREHATRVAASTVHRFLARHRITLKKRTAHASEQERPDVARRRQAWFDGQPDLDPERLIFIDESGATTKMARLRGRAARGERCRAANPARTLENHHLRRRAAPRWHDRAHGARRPDEWPGVSGLCRAGARAHSGARRNGGDGQLARPQGRGREGGH